VIYLEALLSLLLYSSYIISSLCCDSWGLSVRWLGYNRTG